MELRADHNRNASARDRANYRLTKEGSSSDSALRRPSSNLIVEIAVKIYNIAIATVLIASRYY